MKETIVKKEEKLEALLKEAKHRRRSRLSGRNGRLKSWRSARKPPGELRR